MVNKNMSDTALEPVEQKTVLFYDDELPAVVVHHGEEEQVFVPIRPITDHLGLDWSAQSRRLKRNSVLAEVAATVAVTATDGRLREMVCLPLDYLNGWLFGINAERVTPELKEGVIRYQRECFKVLAKAFQGAAAEESSLTPTISALQQVKALGEALISLADEQIAQERRITVAEGRIDQASLVVGDLTKRLSTLEDRVAPGNPVTQEQASQIMQSVKAVAMALSKASGSNQYGAIYGELYRKFGITSYKLLPAVRFQEAMDWLTEWHASMTGSEPF